MNAQSPHRLADRKQLEQFVDAVFRHATPGTFVRLSAFKQLKNDPDISLIRWVPVDDRAALVSAAAAMADEAARLSPPLVFSPPVSTFATTVSANQDNLADGLVLSVECDAHPQRALNILADAIGRPTLIVASGGITPEGEDKLHLYWRLEMPAFGAASRDALKVLRRFATRLVGADGTNIPLVHPLRWPGSWHLKGQPRLARIVEQNDAEIDLLDAMEKLRALLPAEDAERLSRPRRRRDFQPATEEDIADALAALAVIRNDEKVHWDEWIQIGLAIYAVWGGSEEGFEHFDAFSRKSTVPERYGLEETRERWEHFHGSPPTDTGAGALVRRAREADSEWEPPSATARKNEVVKGFADLSGVEPPPRPIIVVAPGELDRLADEVEDALFSQGVDVYTRGDELVRPVLVTAGDGEGGEVLIAKLALVDMPALRDICSSRTMLWKRYDGRKKDYVFCDPDAKVLETLLSRRGLWKKLHPISGVLTAPTLRRSGTLLDRPGYDLETGLYLFSDPALRLPAIAERPSKAVAAAALSRLNALLTGGVNFPFAAAVDRSVALSALMTPVLRGAMSVAPLHVVRAFTPGSGKTYLCQVSSMIQTGQRCPVMSVGSTPEELEKRLDAVLLDGSRMILLDNCNGQLGGDKLAQITSEPSLKPRRLGASEAKLVENQATVFATGNNLVVVEDMVRRAIICTLDAGMERPELRPFPSCTPLDRARAERGELIAAVITIALAYRAAGSPKVVDGLGSYADWTQVVRAPLVWLGEPDPAETMELAREEDPELASHRELFAHWREHLGLDRPVRVGDIISAAEQLAHLNFGSAPGAAQPEFHDFLMRVAGDPRGVSARRLGKWLSRIKGRPVDGCRLLMRADLSHGSRYTLTHADQEQPRQNQSGIFG